MSISIEEQERRSGGLAAMFLATVLSTPFVGCIVMFFMAAHLFFKILIQSGQRIVDLFMLIAFAFAFYLGWFMCLVFGGWDRWWLGLLGLWPISYLFVKFAMRLKE